VRAVGPEEPDLILTVIRVFESLHLRETNQRNLLLTSTVLQPDKFWRYESSGCTIEEELRRIMRDTGFRPVQRNALYGTISLP